MDKLIRAAGLEGEAEPAVPLSEEETMGAGKTPPPQLEDSIGGTSKSALNDHASEVAAEFGDASEQGLGLFTKLGLAGLVLALVYAFIRANSPRVTRMPAGRHGAYEKGGMA